ncbi:MAG: glucuronyl esterase domain-containing protein [Phycisphaerae bacterium]
MNRRSIAAFGAAFLAAVVPAFGQALSQPSVQSLRKPLTDQQRHPEANFDESKVGTYKLPDLLTSLDGRAITGRADWTAVRRPELVRLFEEEQFGVSPPRPAAEMFDLFDTNNEALEGKAIRKQVMISFGKQDGPHIHMLMYLPPSAKDSPAPVFLCLHFSGVQQITDDPGVTLTPVWDMKRKVRVIPTEDTRGKSKGWPVEEILSRGYGLAVMYYGDIEPDFAPGGIQYGVRSLYLKPGDKDVERDDDWGAIAAWGWGLSRAQDYLETDPQVDAKHTIIVGHSRLGKTVLWAGARDTRFAAVIDSCSGEGGASLSRRNYGETVANLNKHFPYQFARNYLKYGAHVDQLPVDSHMLLALIAPRPLYLATASEDRWADPKGVFLAAQAATPVWELFGEKGIAPDAAFPALDTPLVNTLGFQCHNGKHEVTAADWENFLKFADLHVKKAAATAPTNAP